MISLVDYLVKVHLALVLLYLVYRFLVHSSVNLVFKRILLSGSLILMLVLPFIEFKRPDSIRLFDLGDPDRFTYLERLGNIQFLPTSDSMGSIYQMSGISIIFYIYLIINAIILLFVIFHAFRLFKTIRSSRKARYDKLHFIINEKYRSPFSFFNFIFTNSEKEIEKTPEYIHELAHVRQLHSIDRLLVEFMVPMLWINPFIYLFKKSLIEVHEHLADSEVIKKGYEPVEYQKYLFSQLKSGQYFKMTSNFNYSLTKKRITMISKNISKKKSILLPLMSLIMVAGILILFGFNNNEIVDPILKTTSSQNAVNSDDTPSILPLKPGGNYWIGAYFGMRKHPVFKTEKMHYGLDIGADEGVEIIAPANGLIIEVKETDDYGKRIKIQHGNKYVTLFAHLSSFNVKEGDNVKKDDVIGYVGNTGLSTRPHLHYEILKNGEYVNPADYIKNIKEIPLKKSK